MQRKVIFILFLSLVVALHSCKQEDQKAEQECAPLNPNGDSELSLIMRKMATLAEENARAIREGKDLAPYDGSFDKMLNAERSMHIEEDFFQGMAKTYISTINKLYEAKPEERLDLHNSLIQTCQSCHGETCRGPLKRIDKMIVTL
ncbi:MAG: hypothetical protein IPN36_11930 [Bacteroidetes bacterium]|nr:hypothetical protein [Bacteroidota bacterium]